VTGARQLKTKHTKIEKLSKIEPDGRVCVANDILRGHTVLQKFETYGGGKGINARGFQRGRKGVQGAGGQNPAYVRVGGNHQFLEDPRNAVQHCG